MDKYWRRAIIIATVFGIVILVLIRVKLTPPSTHPDPIPAWLPTSFEPLLPSLIGIVDALIAGITVSSVIAVLSLVYLPAGKGNHLAPFAEELIVSIPPANIARQLRIMMQSATKWRFKGACGTFFLADTLPTLAKRMEDGHTIYVSIEMIDPSDDKACSAYSALRIPMKGGSKWTQEYVRRRAYATILAVSLLKARRPAWKVDLRLNSVISSLRYDLADQAVVITHPDPRYDAISVGHKHKFFNAFDSELDLSGSHVKSVDYLNPTALAALNGLKSAFSAPTTPQSSGNDVIALSELLTVLVGPHTLTPDELRAIIDIYSKPEQEY